MTSDEIEAAFVAGRDAPETAMCPHQRDTEAAHWWTRGFSYSARLRRAIEADRWIIETERRTGAAIAETRKACAKICRDIGDGDPEWTVTVGEACANEILALTTEQPRG